MHVSHACRMRVPGTAARIWAYGVSAAHTVHISVTLSSASVLLTVSKPIVPGPDGRAASLGIKLVLAVPLLVLMVALGAWLLPGLFCHVGMKSVRMHDALCVTRRKLQTPGNAEEHKRQETPTINPIGPTDKPHRPSTKQYRKDSLGDA